MDRSFGSPKLRNEGIPLLRIPSRRMRARSESDLDLAADARPIFGACSPPPPSSPWHTAQEDSKRFFPLLFATWITERFKFDSCDTPVLDNIKSASAMPPTFSKWQSPVFISLP